MSGEHNISSSGESQELTLRAVPPFIVHPYYDEDNKAGYVVNDFTILKLSSKVNFSQYPHIRPACLPSSFFRNYDSVSGIVAGWGTSEIRTETEEDIPKETLHKQKVM